MVVVAIIGIVWRISCSILKAGLTHTNLNFPVFPKMGYFSVVLVVELYILVWVFFLFLKDVP